MKKLILICFLCTLLFQAQSQYDFEEMIRLDHTSVKNQAKTGTCWSFATSSFIESELLRQEKGEFDLSEMFVVQNIYRKKANNYVLRQGKANFSQGALAHDLLFVMEEYGVVPEGVFSGLLEGEKAHNHSEMEAGLKGFLDGVIKQRNPSGKWKYAFDEILEVYTGEAPSTFEYEGKRYTPQTFVEDLGIKSDDYINLTSFTHHPFYTDFILEIPDNYSNGSFYNIPLDELINAIDKALTKGFTIAWDGDVSEKGFSAKNGIAILPADLKGENLFTEIGEELEVNQENRQVNFENYSTTDDHLMHIVGTAKDKAGNKYYIIKNSWGEIGEFKGFLYMSESYMRMKTVSVLMHKNAYAD